MYVGPGTSVLGTQDGHLSFYGFEARMSPSSSVKLYHRVQAKDPIFLGHCMWASLPGGTGLSPPHIACTKHSQPNLGNFTPLDTDQSGTGQPRQKVAPVPCPKPNPQPTRLGSPGLPRGL